MPAMSAQSRIVASLEPVPARAFLQHIFQGAKRDRHQHDAGIIGLLEQRQIGLVDLHQKRHEAGDGEARHEVDVEQPVPVRACR